MSVDDDARPVGDEPEVQESAPVEENVASRTPSQEPAKRPAKKKARKATGRIKDRWQNINTVAGQVRFPGRQGMLWQGSWTELQSAPDADDLEQTAGVTAAHAKSMKESQDYKKHEATRSDHRGRLLRLCVWLKENYPNRDQVEDTLTGEVLRHKGTGTDYNVHLFQLNFENLEAGLVMAFLSSQKKRKQRHSVTGEERLIHQSDVHLRKFVDAIRSTAIVHKRRISDEVQAQLTCGVRKRHRLYILHCLHPFSTALICTASSDLEPLSLSTLRSDHKKAMKKECVAQRSKGNSESQEADPIPYPMYRAFAQHMMEAGNIKSWAWGDQEWNLMGRSQHVENLGLKNMKVDNDALRFHHDGGKGDQNACRNTYKHMYANPFDPATCCFTSMGLHMATDHIRTEESQYVFQMQGGDGDTFRKDFYTWCKTLDRDVLSAWVRPEHACPHGFRKGSTTHVSTQTMCPPPVGSVCRRAEWKMGDMLEIYLNFGDEGDRYLGRILAGLNPNAASFATLPPHFTCSMDNETVKEGLQVLYPHLEDKFPGTKGVLMFFLASIVHHSAALMKLGEDNRAHPFNNIGLFQDGELLQRLRALVTTAGSEAILTATGIPFILRLRSAHS